MTKESKFGITENNDLYPNYVSSPLSPRRKAKLSTGITDSVEFSSGLFMGLEERAKESFSLRVKRGATCGS